MPRRCVHLITVTDTGTGISPEILDKIFEPFFTTKSKAKVQGLVFQQMALLKVMVVL